MTDEGALRRTDVLTLARVGETSPMVERGIARLAMVERGLAPAPTHWTPLIIWPAVWADSIYDFGYEGDEDYSSHDVDEWLADPETELKGTALTISDDGQVKGTITDYGNSLRDLDFEWDLATSSGVLKPQVSKRDLVVGEHKTYICNSNAAGVAVGHMVDLGKQRSAVRSPATPCVIESGTITKLPSIEDLGGRATAINTLRDIVGESNSSDGTQKAVMWRGSQMTQLPNAFQNSVAIDVNDRGQIIGYGWSGKHGSYTAPNGTNTHGLLWERSGSPRSLPMTPKAISESGTIIGNRWVEWTGADLREGKSRAYVQRAFVWSGGRAVLLPIPEPFRMASAEGQNERGDIVGSVSWRFVPLKDWPDFPTMMESQPHLMPLQNNVPCVWLRSTTER